MTHFPIRRKATLKDVAHAAGVSISTASRALSNNPIIAESTRRQVQEAAAKLKYRPNAQARALKNSRTNTIGVALPNLQNPYFGQMATTIQNLGRQAGFITIISITNENPNQLNEAINAFIAQQVDGMIIVPHNDSQEALTAVVEQHIPIVCIDREIKDSTIPSVVSDSTPAITEAVHRLIDAQCTPIGFLTGVQNTSTSQQRTKAFQHAAKKAQISDDLIIYDIFDLASGENGAEELIKKGAKSIIAGDSISTAGAIRAFYQLGMIPGEEIALVGFDNFLIFSIQPRPLTVISQDVETMSKQAVKLIMELINGLVISESRILTPTTLEIGETIPVQG
ncbi:transcriptional regulator [Corynebacterium kutscheri]|uniref:Transcriptional regulator n=1 Tax=Corynebacterium kutscheri TaxID=35755 RepID=A0A0F6R3A6_9CORY|nr:LacI family DNA-binding transcriptional regulator [Corynebacterium kutscheri]AKE42158.1 LacI family transcriptional regulator [Corynebacterium kutscheri]VEH05860.1 transcriptional regulator [Corynebacterium kutscheri]VEH10501.1 transcriptional regulator [Corynebacterium kutscheri]VEH81754.1 transcriptional regulator [Corynebacterium kutscheri]